ncbi:hypothetical protein [Verrucosispora sp. NA02020]|uniref:hypothetical protein n=1 Tax=Verrucosispora sp. NA02020 TaxID=2742132 RepID=UPI0015901DDF|nr:hypothetical protein [Verrucosispora sp. NA02020]QKW12252.1 hypothetical protein HUT12_05210 [Verrucosispora sp. NA02020]
MSNRSRFHRTANRFLVGPSLRLALGLAEQLFPTETWEGAPAVDPRDARFLLSGQLGVWSLWRDGLTATQRHAIDRLIHLRPRRLATEGGLRVSLAEHLRNNRSPRYLGAGDFLQVIDGVPVGDLITAALQELEDASSPLRVPPEALAGRRYSSSVFLAGPSRDEFRRNTYLIPRAPVPYPPVPVLDATAPAEVVADLADMHATAELIDKKRGDDAFRLAEVLDGFSRKLRTPQGQPVDRLKLAAGPLQLMIAPTGSGKSVWMRVAATHLASHRGGRRTVVLLTPDVESTLDLVAAIRSDLAALSLDIPVVALMSHRRLIEVAVQRTNDTPEDPAGARWSWQELGYSCMLSDEEGAAWQPGQEPCTDLHEPGVEGRHRCPLIGACEKWAPWRQAAGPAKIIVTNHAYFQQGSVPFPVITNGTLHGRMSAQELLLRRADIVLVDEVDAFQGHAVAQSGRTLVLARRDTQKLLLEKLDDQRKEQVESDNVPGELELAFQRAIHRVEFLSERYLAAVVNGFIDPQDPLGPKQARLHLPRRWDNLLACRLFGLNELEDRPSDDQLDRFKSLFTQNEPDPDALPAGWADLRKELRLVVADEPESDLIHKRSQGIVSAIQTITAPTTDEGEPDADVDLDANVDLEETDCGRQTGKDDDPADPTASAWQLQTAHLLLRRAFLGELQQGLAELEALLPLMRDSGMRLADDVEAALDRAPSWQATPEGPIGRAVFGFAVTGDPESRSDRQFTAEILSGDPHAYTADLGITTAPALTGAPRVIVGLSATAYLPGSPTNHVHADVACYYPDIAGTGTGRLTVSNASVNDHTTNRGIVISGAARNRKAQLLEGIGSGLWDQILEQRLRDLHDHRDAERRARARVLLVTNSYDQMLALCRGLIAGGAHRTRIAVAVPAGDRRGLQIPDDVLAIPASRLRTFPGTGRDVLISPFARVARGLNIVVGHRSALDSIWVCVRPIKLIDEPSALVAHTGAHARRNRHPGEDPRKELDKRHRIAAKHLELINRSNPAFGRLPPDVRTAIFADVLADLIQLAGRARRGGTNTTLHLVDNAFHRGGAAPGSDFASLIRNLHRRWRDDNHLDQVRSIYGTTIDAVFTFASINDRNP